MVLSELKKGEKAKITAVGGEGATRQHFLDMGVIPGTEIEIVRFAPMGDPVELRLHGYELTMRLADAAEIEVEKLEEKGEQEHRTLVRFTKASSAHPGLGEGGKFHPKGSGNPVPKGTVLTYALIGNQNSGKTTLFNQLTGSNQHVGNFPGVTVDRKDGAIKGYPDTLITDLPGIYSMSPYSSEELISRNFLLDEHPMAVINIIDATNIERSLLLTMQILEMDIPMVVALDMMDEVRENGGSIRINEMEEALGVPVVPISAAKNEGVRELVEHAIHIAYYQEKPPKRDFCSEEDHGGAVHRCLHAVMHLIEDHAKASGIPLRFAASKLVEGDRLVLDKLDLDQNEQETLEHILTQMEKERGLDRAAAIADMRFSFIKGITSRTVIKPHETKEHVRSQSIDRILSGKWTAIPAFIAIMALVFLLTFNVIGPFLQGILEDLIGRFSDAVSAGMDSAGINPVLKSLVIKGIFTGVGSVLSFLPIIVTLFFFLSMLEDSGYIARVAFVMDKLLRKIGLSGRSIVPLLIGFGCTVPAVMATRTLPSERDRRMTILLTPFMSCSANVPIYGSFVAAFFPGKGGWIMTGLYVLSILIGILLALVYKRTIFKGEAVPFVMELPNYRIPQLGNVVRLLWEKAKDFLQRAFTVILVATIIIWFLQSFDVNFNIVEDQHQSILALVAGFIAPVLAPLGLGDWRIATSLISGVMAKESVVATMEVLFGSAQGMSSVLTPVAAGALLVFSLLYTPCVAAIASIKREMGWRWAVGVVVWQCAVAWAAALITKLILEVLI